MRSQCCAPLAVMHPPPTPRPCCSLPSLPKQAETVSARSSHRGSPLHAGQLQLKSTTGSDPRAARQSRPPSGPGRRQAAATQLPPCSPVSASKRGRCAPRQGTRGGLAAECLSFVLTKSPVLSPSLQCGSQGALGAMGGQQESWVTSSRDSGWFCSPSPRGATVALAHLLLLQENLCQGHTDSGQSG